MMMFPLTLRRRWVKRYGLRLPIGSPRACAVGRSGTSESGALRARETVTRRESPRRAWPCFWATLRHPRSPLRWRQEGRRQATGTAADRTARASCRHWPSEPLDAFPDDLPDVDLRRTTDPVFGFWEGCRFLPLLGAELQLPCRECLIVSLTSVNERGIVQMTSRRSSAAMPRRGWYAATVKFQTVVNVLKGEKTPEQMPSITPVGHTSKVMPGWGSWAHDPKAKPQDSIWKLPPCKGRDFIHRGDWP